MNNDQQITHLDSRLDTIERNQKTILDMIYTKLKVAEVVIKDAEWGYKVLNIVKLTETEHGVRIEVK